MKIVEDVRGGRERRNSAGEERGICLRVKRDEDIGGGRARRMTGLTARIEPGGCRWGSVRRMSTGKEPGGCPQGGEMSAGKSEEDVLGECCDHYVCLSVVNTYISKRANYHNSRRN